MSELREQLEQGKAGYREARYPGDLAADVLGVRPARLMYGTRPRRHWTVWASVGGLGAVAATVAVVMWRAEPAALTPPTEVAVVSPVPLRGDEEFSVVPELAGASLVPQGGGVVISGETASLVPAVPSFPSMSDVLESVETSDSDVNEENT
jgi:hypothetical protein